MAKRRRTPLPKPFPEFRIQGRFTPDGLVILREHLTAHPEQSNMYVSALFNTTADTINRYRKKFREESGDHTQAMERSDPPVETPKTAPLPISESPSPKQKHLPLPLPEFRIKRNFTAEDVEQMQKSIEAEPEKPNAYFAALFNTQKDTVRYYRERIQKEKQKHVESVPEPIVLEDMAPNEPDWPEKDETDPVVGSPENRDTQSVRVESPEEKVPLSGAAFVNASPVSEKLTSKHAEDNVVEPITERLNAYSSCFTTERKMDIVDTMHDILRSMRDTQTHEAVSVPSVCP